MKKELKAMAEKWMSLERMTLEQRSKAEKFYQEHLMSLIADDYIERNSDLVFETVKYLVVSVGTSYEPIVLNIKLLNPEKILFLYTEKSEKTLDIIVKMCDLLPTEFDKSRVNEVDPLDIYQEIKQVYQRWNKPEKMYIDFTGGTKAMSAAAALAGAMINVQLIYVGTNDYLADFRKPNPGSENLYYIDNPLSVFGDMEIEKAFVLFERLNFSGAKEKLGLLKENIPDPSLRTQLEFVYLLAETYEAWDSLDFKGAYESIHHLNSLLKRDRMHRDFLLMKHKDLLLSQEDVLRKLLKIADWDKKSGENPLMISDTIHALMFTMLQNGLSRKEQQKLDMATLLFYRLLEMIEQRRLAQYNLFVSQMIYSSLHVDENQSPEYAGLDERGKVRKLKENVLEIRKNLFGKNAGDYLAEQVSLLDGFVILSALNDPIIGKGKEGLILLKRIRSMVFLRNNSIFAHGLGPVDENSFRHFSDFVLEIFEKFCGIEDVDFKQYQRIMNFVIPSQNKAEKEKGN